LEGYRAAVEAEKAAVFSTHVLLAQWVVELDAEIVKVDKELDSGNRFTFVCHKLLVLSLVLMR
jgi:hypothetical protein